MAKLRKLELAGIAAAILLAVQPVAADTMGASGGHADDEAALRGQAAEYAKAYAAGDAKTIAGMWTPDGTYTDPDGDQLRGRADIQRFFEYGFRTDGAQPINIKVESLKFPANDVAIEEGTCCIEGGDAAGDTTRYTVVHVRDRDSGKWQMSTVSESGVRQVVNDSLDDLGWLVGHWTATGPKGSMHFRAAWAGDHKFIECAYGSDADRTVNNASTQVIGWNPRSQRIVSWHFGEHGGFGYGTWRKDGQSWVERGYGIEPDGAPSSGSYVLRRLDDNKFTWRSTRRSIAGEPVADTQEIIVTRDGAASN